MWLGVGSGEEILGAQDPALHNVHDGSLKVGVKKIWLFL